MLKERIIKYMSRWFVLGDLTRPIIPFKVNLLYWTSKGKDNVGDLLAKVLYKYLYHTSSIRIRGTRRLALTGSILSFIGGGKTTVFGSGLMNEQCVSALTNPLKKVKLDIRAVRGPRTRKCLIEAGFDCPEVYGDPAILIPLFYKPQVEKVKGKVVIVPHFSKLEKYSQKYDNVLNTITNDWQGFICEIVSAEKVISSSLHGLILAESYGVPAVMLSDIPDCPFKYEDYYFSTGRKKWPIGSTIEECLELEGETNPNLKEM